METNSPELRDTLPAPLGIGLAVADIPHGQPVTNNDEQEKKQ